MNVKNAVCLSNPIRYWAIFICIMCVSCALIDSEKADTSDIYATFIAENDRGGIISGYSATADLTLGGGPFGTIVRLSHGDKLTVSYDSQTYPMTEEGVTSADQKTGLIDYAYNSSNNVAAGSALTFALQRSDHISAPSSTVIMPTAFEIKTPVLHLTDGSLSFSVSDVASTDEKMTWSLNAVCMDDPVYEESFSSASVAISNLDTVKCKSSDNFTLVVEYTRNGSIDPHFGGGTVQAIQSVTKTINGI